MDIMWVCRAKERVNVVIAPSFSSLIVLLLV